MMPTARHLSGVRPGVTMLAISRDPEHQALTYVYSGSVGRFRSACYGRPASHRLVTCQLCARSKRRIGSPSAPPREAESLRCETVQVQGRHPYLVTRPSGPEVVRRRCLRQFRALAPLRGALLMKSTYAGCAVRLLSMTVGRPPYCRRVSFGSTCSGATQRREAF